MARKYRDYKADPTIKAPIIAWFFNRGVFQLVYTGLAAFSVVAMVLLYSTGANAWKKITTEPVDVSPYQEITSVNSSGRDWAEQFIQKIPPSLSGWTVTDVIKPQNIKADNCAFNENPSTTLLSTHVANSGDAEARVLLYGAGQASADFDKYKSLLEKCSNTETVEQEFGKTLLYTNGFLMTMGDAILNVNSTDNTQRDELYNFYYKEMQDSLKASSCLDLNVSGDDSTRSFFYNPENYQGLKETTVVEAQVDTTNIPTVSALTVDEIENPDVEKPESPLPQSFPELPKNEISKPSLPKEIENRDDFSTEAVYNIADKNGPGCGWSWSAQKQPIYDEADLSVEKNTTIVEQQNNIDKEAQSYVDQKNNWAMEIALILPSVNNWNQYAQNVNNVHTKWDWLNTERDKLYEPWHNYVEEHNDWETFDQRKSDAITAYNEELQKCLDKQEKYLEWEEEWGELYAQQQVEENSPTAPTPPEETDLPTDEPTSPENPVESPTEAPTPTDEPTEPANIPDPPENCEILPERPVIMDQEKPSEPQSPAIPEGVTIPDSWEKP